MYLFDRPGRPQGVKFYKFNQGYIDQGAPLVNVPLSCPLNYVQDDASPQRLARKHA